MGRHRKRPIAGGKIVNETAKGATRTDVERRIGLHNQICQSCNANNSERANKCRKCGNTQLRPKKAQYSN